MDIYYLGSSKFKIKGKGATTIVGEGKVAVEDGDKMREFSGPGEYEVSGVSLYGVPGKVGVIFVINQDNLNLVHVGSEAGALTGEESEKIEATDILFVSPQASPLIAQLEPKVIIPMGGEIEKFQKELGAEGVEPMSKLSITKEKLPEEPTVVILKHD